MAFTKIAAAGIGSTGTVTLENLNVTGTITASLTGTATSTTNIPNLTGAITSVNTVTSLGSFSSANLATALTDETGSGSAVFATSPTLVTPVLGTASATSIVVSGISTLGVTSATNLTSRQLNVSGISTFTNGPILVGTATSTGTASQRLQVTGGAYVSGNLGIGTTNPTSKLQVVGDTRVSGVVTAFDFYNDAEYPNVRPTLDLAFSQTKILDSRITFTRASTATYVNSFGILTTAAVNQARFDHNPATGESLGLLVEEARTNRLQYSEQFDNAYWTKDKTAVASNAATAPDGTFTADLLYTITSGVATVGRVTGAVSSAPYTSTIYLKSAGFTWAVVYAAQGNHIALFNLVNGTVGTQTAGITAASISPVGNGWFRCSVTQTATFATFYVSPADANGSTTSTASGTSGIYAWGAQLEAGSFPTSYIPTTSATVTRAADVASITGTNFSSWYNATQGTLLAFQRSLAGQDAYQTATFTLSSSNPNAELIGMEVTNDYNRFYVYGNGNTAASYNYAPVTPGTLTKNALAYQVDNVAAVRNGGTVATDASVGIPSAIDRANLGHNLIYGQQKQQTIARLAYYPVRLPDAQLQTITL
jgi:hypothetical protein